MNSKKFSGAMGEIDDKYVYEAIRYNHRSRKSRWLIRGAIAACLCLLIVIGQLNRLSSDFVSVPGLFTITAYALSSNDETGLPKECELSEGVELSKEYGWSLAMSSRPGLPLKLSMADYPNATFDISVDGGRFVLWDSGKVTVLDSTFNVGNETTIYWTNLLGMSENRTGVQRYTKNEAYADIIVRDGDSIVGYAVIKVYTPDPENEPAQSYYALLLKSISFPKIDGKNQNVTEEYVNSQIEQVKAAN